jgi:rhodanese-related sulfurtransferase
MGEQRRFNYALRPMTREQFITLVTADQPDAPPYFTMDAVLNTRERPTLEATLEQEMQPLTLGEFLTLAADGAQILDVRQPEEFAAGHLRNALNIGLSGQYATWAGTVLDPDRPILLIAGPGREQEAALRLGRIGFDRVRGYLGEGMAALADRPDLLSSVSQVMAPEVAADLAKAGPPFLLDVRAPREWAARHIEGSRNLPLNRLRDHLGDIPRDRSIIVHCAGGYRSSIAASLLQQQGITRLLEMTGGLAAWDAASLPVVAEITA